MSSTEIGSLFAMPNALESGASKPAIAVAVLNEPVLWSYERVQVVFCLSIPKSNARMWEDIFNRIYDYFVQGLGVRELLDNPSFDLLLERIAQ